MNLHLPRRLSTRLVALVVAVGLLSLALHVWVLYSLMGNVARDFVGHLAARVLLQRALLERTPAAEREAVAQAISEPRFVLVPADAGGDAVIDPPWPAQELLRDVHQRLGRDFELAFVEPRAGPGKRRLRVGFFVQGRAWAALYEPAPPVLAFTGTLVGWPVLIALAVIGALVAGVRMIGRPLAQIGAAIASQDANLAPIAMPAHASLEVQTLVRSFNELAASVRAADETKQQLLAGVSHDLRTPLARLRLRIETQCEPAVAEAAEGELRAVEHIVSQFLAFVHGDSGAGLGADESVLTILDQVVASYAEQRVDVRVAIDAPDARRGELAVRRLLENLIDNAIAHGRPPIEITWRSQGAGRRELGVWDRGSGLSDQQFKAALQPFVRLSGDAAIGHCGLGLAIVALIAGQWGAQLACRRDGQGRFGVVVAWDTPGI